MTPTPPQAGERADLIALLREALPYVDTNPDLHRYGGDELAERISATLNALDSEESK